MKSIQISQEVDEKKEVFKNRDKKVRRKSRDLGELHSLALFSRDQGNVESMQRFSNYSRPLTRAAEPCNPVLRCVPQVLVYHKQQSN